jgi:hypothetical protein
MLNRWVEPAPVNVSPRRQSRIEPRTDRPGDHFSSEATWSEILGPHGWRCDSQSGSAQHWCRPGKDTGCSATTGFCESADGIDLLYVFSTNAEPFEADGAYSKFAAYAVLEHEGNYVATAQALRARGYGTGAAHAVTKGPVEESG